MITQALEENCELKGTISHLEVKIQGLKEKLAKLKKDEDPILCEVA